MPASSFIRVVLPAPLGPTRTTLSPRSISRSRPRVDDLGAVGEADVVELGDDLAAPGRLGELDPHASSCRSAGASIRSIFSIAFSRLWAREAVAALARLRSTKSCICWIFFCWPSNDACWTASRCSFCGR